eukprot:NODE_29_length_33183_cov_0.333666.p24 type:complete len:124 gc:universal NODE_29_length_33183_cov_0.333666:13823-13452(-)
MSHLDVLNHFANHIGHRRKCNFIGSCQWEVCSVERSNRFGMVSHLKVHFDVRPFTCPCNKGFKRKHDLLVHMNKCKYDPKPCTYGGRIPLRSDNKTFVDPVKDVIFNFERHCRVFKEIKPDEK